ncbi:MAG: hypothetical protein A2X94_16960 [Bdellovibrionales bacterium GWB1_55_8]|nr:MAG: hypothetical protein A2X94_16960 [Bdellovibrionales bacterium GWB1_55_8]
MLVTVGMNAFSRATKLGSVLGLFLVSVSGQAAPPVAQQDDAAFEQFYQRVLQIRQDTTRHHETLVFAPDATEVATDGVRFLGEWDRQEWGSSDSPNGDIVFLIGHLEADPTRHEMSKFHGMIKWATSSGFRAVMDPAALDQELDEVVQSANTAVIIWSSHGSKDGRVYDARENPIDNDSFSKGATSKLKMYVLSNCFGDQTTKYYSFAPDSTRIHWSGTTNSNELFEYLYSSRFDLNLRSLGFSI